MTYRQQIATMFSVDAKFVMLRKHPAESYMSKTQEEGVYALQIGAGYAAGFTLVCMPGCCGILISTGCFVNPGYQRRGLGTLLNNMRKQMAWEMGYTLLMCTDVVDNTPQQKILSDWTKITSFDNRRTGNHILMHEYKLHDTGIATGF